MRVFDIYKHPRHGYEAVKRGFDMVMLTSDLNSLIAGVRRQLDDLKSKIDG